MRDTRSQGADDLRARLEEAERDGAKLQGFNQRLAARVAELEKQQEAGKAPACPKCGNEAPHGLHTSECPEAPAKYGFPLAPPGDPAHIEAPACECRQFALEMAELYGEDGRKALTALSAPCPLRAELAELRAEHESAGKRWAKTFVENDSLRAKVETVRAIADQARLSDRDLRGALEAIDAALRDGQ